MSAIRMIESELGLLRAEARGGCVVGLGFVGEGSRELGGGESSVLDLLEEELGAYFAGKLRGFSVLVEPAGTLFQRGVWAELLKIPYGETVSYGEVARRIGRPTASRAVGAANGANPVAILVPCHRVVDSRGGLHGYAGGLDRKRRLLEVEGVVPSDGLGSGGLFTLSS